MQRVLLLATTTGYQTRAFGDAAERLGVELVFATDRCHVIDDPWQDRAIPIRFYDESASVAAILESARERPIDGLLAVGDRPTVIAAHVAKALGLPWHPPVGAAVARHKLRTRECLRDAGLPVPWFVPFELFNRPIADHPIADHPMSFPCVVKPVALSGSRGVIRANDREELAAAIERLQALMHSSDIRSERDEAHEIALVEEFIPGREYAIDALLHDGQFHLLAIFDKPDPLDGPFFEETIYVTPSRAPATVQQAIERSVARAARALGLQHGPIHAECRVNEGDVFVLEVAARPIGGLCARALRIRVGAEEIALEEALLRHAMGESPEHWRREAPASGVMMIPIPRRGVLRHVDGVEAAREVPHVDDLRITAKLDQLLVPLPEGASYLGFIFARAARRSDVEKALRAAHAWLRFTVEPELPVLGSTQVHYNLDHA